MELQKREDTTSRWIQDSLPGLGENQMIAAELTRMGQGALALLVLEQENV